MHRIFRRYNRTAVKRMRFCDYKTSPVKRRNLLDTMNTFLLISNLFHFNLQKLLERSIKSSFPRYERCSNNFMRPLNVNRVLFGRDLAEQSIEKTFKKVWVLGRFKKAKKDFNVCFRGSYNLTFIIKCKKASQTL